MVFLQKLVMASLVALPCFFAALNATTWLFRKTGIRGISASIAAMVGGGVVSGMITAGVASLFPEHADF